MKHIISILSFLLFTHAAFAENAPMAPVQNTANATPTTAPNNSSFAVTLARQAGLIGGAAQACGQDISLLSARLDEAIMASATSTGDISDAVAAYQQSVKETAEKQTAEKIMPCDMVLKDYQKLPLLRDDYKEVVISALNADRVQRATSQTSSTATPQPGQTVLPKTTP